MTNRGVPFAGLGKGSIIRFDRADIVAMENTLGCGYTRFTAPGIFGSLTATTVFIHRGLREENTKGDLVHAFPLTDAGREQAGDLVWSYLGSNDKGAGTLNDAIIDAFITCGLWKPKAADDKTEPGKDQEQAPKNLPT